MARIGQSNRTFDRTSTVRGRSKRGTPVTTNQKTAALYSRFSSDLQNDRSIEDQFAVCRTYAAREGFNIVREFEDRAKTSATLFDRDGFLELMHEAKAHKFDIVIVESLDRVSRDPE